jgi:hypothetical protein
MAGLWVPPLFLVLLLARGSALAGAVLAVLVFGVAELLAPALGCGNRGPPGQFGSTALYVLPAEAVLGAPSSWRPASPARLATGCSRPRPSPCSTRARCSCRCCCSIEAPRCSRLKALALLLVPDPLRVDDVGDALLALAVERVAVGVQVLLGQPVDVRVGAVGRPRAVPRTST